MSKLRTIGSAIVGISSSILAFLGMITCCGLPIIAGILASIGIGASQLTFFAQYKNIFIGAAILSLLFGFYQLYFKKEKSCCSSTDTCCNSNEETENNKSRKSNRIQKIILWLAAAIVISILVWGDKLSNTDNSLNNVSIETTKKTSCCPTKDSILEEPEPVGCCQSLYIFIQKVIP
ncbi:hypothetical protein [Proteiniphilum sp.]|uniref:hypothetical protein n=1 Tax=Proteiniphilum sp. TaxID=1926877 RepID=UPI003326E86D